MPETTAERSGSLNLVDRIKSYEGPVKDAVCITATSGVTSLTVIPNGLANKMASLGISSSQPYLAALIAVDLGAGMVAGYTKRLGTSLAVYGATLIPEMQSVFTGNGEEALYGFLTKTLVYGVGYSAGSLLHFHKKNKG